MRSAERLLRFYPRAWRERYGEEFLATAGDGPLGFAKAIDILAGVIDAWLSADVRAATRSATFVANRGGAMTLKSMFTCEVNRMQLTVRDGVIGASIMIVGTPILSMLGRVAAQYGWAQTSEVLGQFG